MNTRTELEVTVNQYGVRIRKCCASCKDRDFDDKELRCCKLTGKHVRGNNVCDKWSLSNRLETLGCEHGKVQCRAYQLFLLEVRTSELDMRVRGKEVTPASVESIRKDFELSHGTRFAIH
jgi:hypothetical protein